MFRKKIDEQIGVPSPEIAGGAVSTGVPGGGEVLTNKEIQSGSGYNEKKTDTQKETKIPQSPTQTQIKTQGPAQTTQTVVPKVWGYKISPSLVSNLGKVRRGKSSADPKTGIGCLYMLIDRLFRMQTASA